MLQYIHRLNIEHFERLLLSETDPEKIAMLSRLLEEERSKDNVIQCSEAPPSEGAAASRPVNPPPA